MVARDFFVENTQKNKNKNNKTNKINKKENVVSQTVLILIQWD